MGNNITNIHTVRMFGVVAGMLALFAGVVWMLSAVAHAASEPVISAVSVAPTNTGATVTWTTDEMANSQIAYGTSLPYTATTTLDTTPVTSHSGVLSGLTPDTTYHYEIISSDASNNTNMSADGTFMTSATAATTTAALTLNVYSGVPGSLFTVTGSGFSPTEPITVLLGGTSTPAVTADSNGNFSTVLTVPLSATGNLTVTATGGTSGRVATSTFSVTPAATTTAPVISSVVATPTDTEATITWTTSSAASSQVSYGLTSSYGNATTLDNTQVTSHSTTITGLTAGTTYHFQVLSTSPSGNASSSDSVFTTTNTSGSTTTLQGEITQLQSEVSTLQGQVTQLQSEVAALKGNQGSPTGTGTGPTSAAYIDQNGQSVRAGTTIDFGGHNFLHEENVSVIMDGNTVASAHADGGGNFSTGSVNVPSTPGTYTYLFTGQNGDSANATITVTP